MQCEERNVMAAADVVDQLPRRGDRYTLGRDDHQVIAIGEVHRLEQWVESFFFAEQHAGDVARWPDDVDVGVGKLRRDDLRLLHLVQIIADLDRPASEAAVSMGLLEMTARVVDDIPIDAVLFDVIRQQCLREISVRELLILGHRHDLGAGLVVDLPRHGRQRVIAARGHVGRLHHFPCRFLLRRAWLPGHARGSISDIAGMPLLGFLLPRPFAGRGFDRVDDVVRDVARARVSHRAAPRCRSG